jgi:hypothetical protein
MAARRALGQVVVHGYVEADNLWSALESAEAIWPGCGVMPPDAARQWMRANGAAGNELRQRAAWYDAFGSDDIQCARCNAVVPAYAATRDGYHWICADCTGR